MTKQRYHAIPYNPEPTTQPHHRYGVLDIQTWTIAATCFDMDTAEETAYQFNMDENDAHGQADATCNVCERPTNAAELRGWKHCPTLDLSDAIYIRPCQGNEGADLIMCRRCEQRMHENEQSLH